MFQHSIKNIYLGKYFEKTANLKTQSLADLQADGWDNIYINKTSYTLDSNGLVLPYVSGNSGVSAALMYHYDGITANNKITLNATGLIPRTYSSSSYDYNAAFGLGLVDDTTPNESNDMRYLYPNGIYGVQVSSRPTYINSGLYYNGTLQGTAGTANVGGDFDCTIVIDLPNKTVEYSTTAPTSPYSRTMTLTDAQITTILTYKYICFNLTKVDQTVVPALYTASIIIS